MGEKVTKQFSLAALAMIAGVFSFGRAAAEPPETGAAASPASDDVTLDEIVVTSQRRRQSVLSVASSVQADTAAELNDLGIHDLVSLQFNTPGLLPLAINGFTQFYIRGEGNNIFVGADPAVATFIDDVPRLYGTMIDTFVDVDRVEVLKGAQGGLYGRNATGGVVNVITKQPSTDGYFGSGLVDYGTFHSVRVGGYVNLPLSDKVALLLGGERDSHDPYIKNVAGPNPYTPGMFPGGSALYGSPADTAATLNSVVNIPKGIANQDFWAADTKVLFTPTDNFKITLAGDYADKQDSDGNQSYQPNPGYAQAVLSTYIGLFTGATPNLPPGFLLSSGKFQLASPTPEHADVLDDGGSLTAVWSLPGVDLTGISAYRAQRTSYYSEFFAYSAPGIQGAVASKKYFTYDELRAVSTGSGPLHFLGGATLLENHSHNYVQTYLVPPAFTAPFTSSFDVVHNWSVYAQGEYDVTRELSATFSGRYVHETNNMNFYTPAAAIVDSTEKKFLPSATLSYKVGDGNAYVRYAKGFKAGGVNPINPANIYPAPEDGEVFGPETVDTYELGYRNSLLDQRMQVTAALFKNNISGAQAGLTPSAAYEALGANTVITNVGKERTWGAEVSVAYRVTRPLTLSVNLAGLDAKYTDYVIPPGNPIFAPINRNGQTMINSPKWQASTSASLDLPLNGKLHLIGSALEYYTSNTIFQYTAVPGVLPDATQGGYGITNLRIGIQTADEKYSLSFYANNVFDRGYVTSGSTSSSGNFLQWGSPRVMGAEIKALF
jgi:iron complex outermembrane receptor protein